MELESASFGFDDNAYTLACNVVIDDLVYQNNHCSGDLADGNGDSTDTIKPGVAWFSSIPHLVRHAASFYRDL